MCGIRGYFGSSDQGHKELDQILTESFSKIKPRGPDATTLSQGDRYCMGFHRLAIMDTSEKGMQPFIIQTETEEKSQTIQRTTNGEIYAYKKLLDEYDLHTKIQSQSDCEPLGHIFLKEGFTRMCEKLDGEFAIALIDTQISKDSGERKEALYLGRDPFGVRPLFWGTRGDVFFRSSEIKGLTDVCDTVAVFDPGTTMRVTILDSGKLHVETDRWYDYKYATQEETQVEGKILDSIYKTYTDAIQKRLISDRPVGCLLSGGLDSSLVCGIAQKLTPHRIKTFTIGLEGGTDIIYAQKVASYICSDHTTHIVTIQEALEAIDTVIYTIESRDTTTIRASVWQYLIGKYISEHTDIKVILTGEGSDELTGGYLYFHKAPSDIAFHEECISRLQDIHRYDGLRVDRAMSCHGLEVRIPFLDTTFVQTYVSTPTHTRRPQIHGDKPIEKYLLRSAFSGRDIIPEEVLWRKKEAFSDGVSQTTKSWFQIIQDHIDTMISDEEFETHKHDYPLQSPDTKEKYYYCKKYREFFGEKAEHVIPYYWLPKWVGEKSEPSARVLEDY